MTVVLVPPRADWSGAFSAFAERIRKVAPIGSCLHHIGSTAVPGLVAKDVIDIQLTVDSFDDVDADRMAEIGFDERQGLHDHALPGRDLPAVDLAKRFFNSSGRSSNLHVRRRGSFNQRYPLLCRDYLRAHPNAAAAYGAFKLRLAALAEDHHAYADAKDPVFDLIMIAAEDWALQTGWREPSEDN